MSMNDRKAAILRAVIEQYVETAQPVGSGVVARSPGVEVSSATVRSDMGTLEDEGYLEQPHTSAGRVPTEKGYRFFVDALGHPATLDGDQRAAVSSFFSRAHGELESMLDDTSRLLVSLTDYAAVVVGPQHEGTQIRSTQFVGLSDKIVLLVVVLANGSIDKHTLELADPIDDARLAAATAHLSAHVAGSVLGAVGPIPESGDGALDDLLGVALAFMSSDAGTDSDQVFVGGRSQMAASFDAVDTVKQVLTILEQQLVVVSLLRDVIDRGMTVAIGTETGIQRLADCSVVVAPYEVDGETAGTVGVLGPTRMDYSQALAAVEVVGRRLGTHLSEA